jgi:hypothetical protein
MPASVRAEAEVDGGAPLLIRRADRAPLGGLLLVIAMLWLAAAISGFLGGNLTIVPSLGAAGAYLAGALGVAFAMIALDWMVRGRTVVICRHTVAVTDRSLLGGSSWQEPLANYREIRACREQRSYHSGVRSWYLVRLWHPEPAKAVELARAKDPARIEQRARDYAQRLGLPLSWQWSQATASGACDAERRSPRRMTPAHRIGVIGNTTTSLAAPAARVPAAATVSANSPAGGMPPVAIRTEHQS